MIIRANNPCLSLEQSEFYDECFLWRDRRPKEYNRFYDALVKNGYPDSLLQKLPRKIILLKDKN